MSFSLSTKVLSNKADHLIQRQHRETQIVLCPLGHIVPTAPDAIDMTETMSSLHQSPILATRLEFDSSVFLLYI